MIYLTIKGQKLNIAQEVVASDTIDYLELKATFTSEWDGLTKFVHFVQGDTSYIIELEDDAITKDKHLNLTKGEWIVSVHGNLTESGEVTERATTTVAQLYVKSTGTLNGEPLPITPASVGEQILAKAENAVTLATKADTNATEALDKAKNAETDSEEAVETANEAKELASGLNEKITNETTRAEGVEETLVESLVNETNRAKAREDEIEAKIPSHEGFATKEELNAEVERAEGVEETLDKKFDGYSLITETGNIIDLSMDSSTYVLKAILKDKNGNVLSNSTEIDLPLESLVLNVEYDSAKKAIIITLKDGTTKEVPVSDLISGLVNEDTFNTEMAKKVDKVDGSSLMTEAEHTKLSGIEEGANKYVLPSDVVQDAKYVHTDNNFTSTEKEQISTNKEDIEDLQDDKVDKVDGKGLSTNDFTDSLKEQIGTNANDIGNLNNNKVDKVDGKQLSSNDFTDSYKNQIDTNKTNIETLQGLCLSVVDGAINITYEGE